MRRRWLGSIIVFTPYSLTVSRHALELLLTEGVKGRSLYRVPLPYTLHYRSRSWNQSIYSLIHSNKLDRNKQKCWRVSSLEEGKTNHNFVQGCLRRSQLVLQLARFVHSRWLTPLCGIGIMGFHWHILDGRPFLVEWTSAAIAPQGSLWHILL